MLTSLESINPRIHDRGWSRGTFNRFRINQSLNTWAWLVKGKWTRLVKGNEHGWSRKKERDWPRERERDWSRHRSVAGQGEGSVFSQYRLLKWVSLRKAQVQTSYCKKSHNAFRSHILHLVKNSCRRERTKKKNDPNTIVYTHSHTRWTTQNRTRWRL